MMCTTEEHLALLSVVENKINRITNSNSKGLNCSEVKASIAYERTFEEGA